MTLCVPELLAPAGNLEKLKVAILYGANAVYLGGQNFGLRSAADNFTQDELQEGVAFAHAKGAKAFVVLNSFLHDFELEELPAFLKLLKKWQVDAVIVSDLGVIATIKKNCNIPIHLSTQASCLNSEAALFWRDCGVVRIVLGREVSISDACKIKKKSGLEVEMFIHGSMCMAYSGNCVISNYTQGRDSNRGGCAHSCRFSYDMDLQGKESSFQSYFMSSKDLQGIAALPEFMAAGIDSLKVEGRMKSHYYAGTVTKVYANALEEIKSTGAMPLPSLKKYSAELLKVSHRKYSEASLKGAADESSLYNERESETQTHLVAGMVAQVAQGKFILLEVRHFFYPGDRLELLPFKGDVCDFTADFIHTLLGESVVKTKPGTLVKLPYVKQAEMYNLVRIKRDIVKC